MGGNIFLLQREHDQSHSVLSSLSNEDGSVLWNYSYSIFPAWGGGRQPLEQWPTVGSKKEVYVNGVKLKDGTCSLQVFDFNGKALRNMPCLSDAPRYGEQEDVFVTVMGKNVLAHSGAD